MIRRPPSSPLFPYPTLSRSAAARHATRSIPRPVQATRRSEIGEPFELAGAVAEHVNRDPQLLQNGDMQVRQRLLRVSDVAAARSEEHTSELQSQSNIVCRLL